MRTGTTNPRSNSTSATHSCADAVQHQFLRVTARSFDVDYNNNRTRYEDDITPFFGFLLRTARRKVASARPDRKQVREGQPEQSLVPKIFVSFYDRQTDHRHPRERYTGNHARVAKCTYFEAPTSEIMRVLLAHNHSYVV